MLPELPPDIPIDVPQTAIMVDAAPAPAPAAAAPIRVESHGYVYEVVGNTLLAPALIEARLAVAADPRAAFAAVNQAYQEAGYFLVALRGGLRDQTLTIQVVEGRLTEVTGPEELQPYFKLLKDRPALGKNEVLRQGALAELYAGRQGQRPKIRFEPAEAQGSSRMVLTEEPIENAKPWSANLGVGNYGNRYSSRMLAQAGGSWRPGAGTELSLAYTVGLPNAYEDSQGSQYDSGSVGGSVVTPWGVYGANYSRAKYEIGGTAGGLLVPRGDITNWSLSGSQLLYADETSRWALTESFNSSDTTITVFDDAFTLTEQGYYYFTVGTTYNRSLQTFGYKSAFSAGLTLQQGLSDSQRDVSAGRSGRADSAFSDLQRQSGLHAGLAGRVFAGRDPDRAVDRRDAAAGPAVGVGRLRQPDRLVPGRGDRRQGRPAARQRGDAAVELGTAERDRQRVCGGGSVAA